ncbi:MAG: HD domain-containing protein [Planctomycetota bacterium]
MHTLIEAAKARFPMSLDGIHGLSHWQRVKENGLAIALHTGANPVAVEAFAFLHDCCRESDGTDPHHGPRAAAFARSLLGKALILAGEEFAHLEEAIQNHTQGRRSRHPLIATCWDADRLDLGRVGVRPHPRFLSTDHARLPETIRWAYTRSRAGRR